jgi:hypothetical protein
MHASRLLASQLRTAAVSSKPIVELCIRYNEVLKTNGTSAMTNMQTQNRAACGLLVAWLVIRSFGISLVI